jgi:hypothetical protein
LPLDGPDAWVATPDRLRPLTLEELPPWLDEELWLVEVGQPSQARLVERQRSWTPEVARAFAEACAWRAREQGARALERAGEHELAAELGSLTTLADVERWAASTPGVDDLPLHAALAADAACLSVGRRPDTWRRPPGRGSRQPPALLAANLGFVVAHGAGLAATMERGADAYPDGVATERAWQLAWLVEALGLDS